MLAGATSPRETALRGGGEGAPRAARGAEGQERGAHEGPCHSSQHLSSSRPYICVSICGFLSQAATPLFAHHGNRSAWQLSSIVMIRPGERGEAHGGCGCCRGPGNHLHLSLSLM